MEYNRSDKLILSSVLLNVINISGVAKALRRSSFAPLLERSLFTAITKCQKETGRQRAQSYLCFTGSDCRGTYFWEEIHRLVLKTCLGYCSAGFHPCTRWDPVAVPNAHCCHKIEVRLLLLAVSYLHHPNIWGGKSSRCYNMPCKQTCPTHSLSEPFWAVRSMCRRHY